MWYINLGMNAKQNCQIPLQLGKYVYLIYVPAVPLCMFKIGLSELIIVNSFIAMKNSSGGQ